MSVMGLALVCLLTSGNVASCQDYKISDFKLDLATLPSAAKPVESCTNLITVANSLIKCGPRVTRQLFDEY